MAHTPGSWKVFGCFDNGFGIASQQGNVVIQSGLHGNPNEEDDARLIAAAPELLEACERLLSEYTYDWKEVDLSDRPSDFDELCYKASAAIAKAKGEEPK